MGARDGTGERAWGELGELEGSFYPKTTPTSLERGPTGLYKQWKGLFRTPSATFQHGDDGDALGPLLCCGT